MSALLEKTQAGAIVELRLNNPSKYNLLSFAMLEDLGNALDDIEHDIERDDSVRVVIISATGKAFCAGHDLKEMTSARTDSDGGLAHYQQLFAECSELMKKIVRFPRPIIAQVQGTAVAAGCQLVASCDLAIAAQSARFGVNGVNIGLFCSTPMVALTRNIGRKRAFEMLTTGALLSAEEAAACGLINRTVADEQLTSEVHALAQTIADKSPVALKIGKRAFYAQAEMTLDAAYEYTAQVMVENMMESQTKQGIADFLDRK